MVILPMSGPPRELNDATRNMFVTSSTFSKSAEDAIDRFPTGNDSVPFNIYSSSALLQFVKDSRVGFSKYAFPDDLHFGEDNLITLHWTLDTVFSGSDTA